MVIDNFYSNPEEVISLLDGDYPIIGCGVGRRSVGLRDLDENLYQQFCNAIYNIHGIKDPTNLYMYTFFMEHTFNEIDIFNTGWVHIDGKNPDACRMTVSEYNLVLCGSIHLTPNPDPSTGVSLYKLKDHVNWSQQEIIDKTINDYTIPREDYDAGKITLEEYSRLHKEYHSNFEMTHNFDNMFNRMVSWQGGTLHGQNMSKDMPKRLNQYFFVQQLQ